MASPAHNAVEKQPLSATVNTQQIGKDDNEKITEKFVLAEMKSMEVRMKLHMDQIFARFTDQLTATECRISATLESELELMSDVGSVFQNRLDAMDRDIFKRDELKAEIADLKSELRNLKRQQRQHRDTRQRLAKEATIVGIDIDETQDLQSVFQQVCEYIEFTLPELSEISRLEPIPSESNISLVVAKFLTVSDRNRTIEAFSNFQKKNKGPLKMRDVGFANDSTFRIYESLTLENRRTLQYAYSRKHQNHLHEVFTYKSAVYVRLRKGSPSIQVTSKKHLKNLITH